MSDLSLEQTLAALPEELRQEVADFAAFLLAKRKLNTSGSDTHPLAPLAGVWRDEPLSDEDLLGMRSLGREVDL